jgi:hypothetical protein
MSGVFLNKKSTLRAGSAQVELPGRRRRAIVRWKPGSASVCASGLTHAERTNVLVRVVGSLGVAKGSLST